MRCVSAEEIRVVLDFPSLIDALVAAHLRPRMETADALLGHAQEAYFTRHALDTGRFMASKLITSFPVNLAHRCGFSARRENTGSSGCMRIADGRGG